LDLTFVNMSSFALLHQQCLRIAAHNEMWKQQNWRHCQSMARVNVQPPPGVHVPAHCLAEPDCVSLKLLAPPSPTSSAPTTAPPSPVGSFRAPPGLAAPPGLLPPPGLGLSLDSSIGTDDESDVEVVDLTGPSDRCEGVHVSSEQDAGVTRHHVQWELVQFRQRARQGKALLSPTFTAGGLTDARLMLYPNLSKAAMCSKGQSRKLRAKYRQQFDNSGVNAELKVKAQGSSPELLRFSATVDGTCGLPIEYDFSQQVTLSCGHFNIKVADTDVVTVSVEIEGNF